MTVAELIAQLQQEDPNHLVVMSKDAEGNAFSPLESVDASRYVEETTWSGDLGDPAYGGYNSLCLWPVN